MSDAVKPERLVLDAGERRVVGTLIEKGLTNPQYYPLSLNLLVTGCNQRNNREPVTNYEDADVEEICARLQARNLVAALYPSTGRVVRYRQELGRMFELNATQLAVIGELLLRGAQSEGELRQRASRMREIASLEDLDAVLLELRQRVPPFVVRLTPEGVSRGVRYTHACAPEDEAKAQLEAERAGAPMPVAAPPPRRAADSEVAELKARVDDLERRIAALENRTA